MDIEKDGFLDIDRFCRAIEMIIEQSGTKVKIIWKDKEKTA